MKTTQRCYVCGNDVDTNNSHTHKLPNDDVSICHTCVDRKAMAAGPTPSPTILDEAARLTNGDRHDAYGPYDAEAADVSLGWDVIIRRNGGMTTRLVPLMMIWLKLCREAHKAHRDNLVDICGYAHLASKLPNATDA